MGDSRNDLHQDATITALRAVTVPILTESLRYEPRLIEREARHPPNGFPKRYVPVARRWDIKQDSL